MNKKLVILFVIASLFWIYGTNYLTHQFVPHDYLNLINRAKEFFYVLAAGAALYFSLKKSKELHDVTEKMQMSRKLAISEKQYKSLFEYNPDLVYMLDLNGNITNLNAQFEPITGYKREMMIGRNIQTILPDRYHRFLENFLCSFAASSCKKPIMYELKLQHLDGHPIHLQCTSLPIVIEGRISGIIGYGRDVTSLRIAEERLRRAEKLSVVGELSASVAHEIRNPLTSLKGFVQLLQKEETNHPFYFQIMLDELNRINDIVSELLLLAKPQHVKFVKADVETLLGSVISLLGSEASLYNVQIGFDFPEMPVIIECEPNQLKQLFINVIKNAIEATKDGGRVLVSIQPLEEQILITVKDNGCGISKERLKKIGEPFYSSKEKGTGLGLTVSFKIVQSHQGTIQFDSHLHQGTSVHIRLPRNQSYFKNRKNE